MLKLTESQPPNRGSEKSPVGCSHTIFREVNGLSTGYSQARQASLTITISRSLPKLMSIVSVMPTDHLILCHPLLFFIGKGY